MAVAIACVAAVAVGFARASNASTAAAAEYTSDPMSINPRATLSADGKTVTVTGTCSPAVFGTVFISVTQTADRITTQAFNSSNPLYGYCGDSSSPFKVTTDPLSGGLKFRAGRAAVTAHIVAYQVNLSAARVVRLK